MPGAGRRHHFLIRAACLLIAAAAALYAIYFYDWLRGGAPAGPRAAAGEDAALQAARAEFRGRFLDCPAHLRLAEALRKSGRPIDAFYVMDWARSFFGEEAFARAHSLVVLHAGRHFVGEESLEATPAKEAGLKARLAEHPQDPLVLGELARIAQAQKRTAQARQLVESGLAAHPGDPGLLAFRAELDSAAGERRAAVEDWTRLAAAAPGTFEARIALEALGGLVQGQPAGAEDAALARQALEELLRSRPQDPLVFSTLAMAVWQQGDLAGVRALVTEALAKRPTQAGALMVQGALALNDRDVEKAIRLLTQAWGKNPEDLYTAAKLAQLHLKARADPEAALPFYLALYRANPNYEDGEPAQRRVREILDARREAKLVGVRPEALGRFLSSDDASLRAEAAARVARAKDPRWVQPLADLLDDDTEIVRHNADYALYEIARAMPDAVRVRRDDWIHSPKALVRVRALNLFADLEPQPSLPLVVRALRDPEPAVRYLVRAMVLDHYYQGSREAAQARADYLAWEKDPQVLALTAPAQPR